MESSVDYEKIISIIKLLGDYATDNDYKEYRNALTVALAALHEKSARERIVYDTVEEYPNCTVQVLTDSKTGECSVGWWKNE